MANLPAFDANGLTVLSQPQVLENLKESIFNASALGPTVSTGDHTVLGMHLEANSIEISFLYDLLDDINASGDIDSAEGVQQDNLNRQRGAVRNEARNSTAIVSCGGVNGTNILVGSLVAIGGGGERWTTNVAITIAGGSTDVAVTAENTGAIEAAIGAIDTIVTTTTGWNTVTNAAEAEEGEAVESNADYRLRSEDTGTGTTTEEAVFTRLSEVDDIDAVVVTSNRTDTTDALGTLPHQMWIVIHPNTADPQNIAETIWGEAGAAGGINMRGAQTATVTDSNGNEQQIRWDWAASVDTWISAVGTKDANYPIDGDNLVKQAIEGYFVLVRVGGDVNPAPIEGAITTGTDGVPGITTLDVLMKIGGAPGGGDVGPIAIAINQYALLNGTIGVTIT